jgi:TATA-binding protein-associated factor
MVIPVLGRMTDSSTDIRLLASNVFATLVKIMPLEVCSSSCIKTKASLIKGLFVGGHS